MAWLENHATTALKRCGVDNVDSATPQLFPRQKFWKEWSCGVNIICATTFWRSRGVVSSHATIPFSQVNWKKAWDELEED